MLKQLIEAGKVDNHQNGNGIPETESDQKEATGDDHLTKEIKANGNQEDNLEEPKEKEASGTDCLENNGDDIALTMRKTERSNGQTAHTQDDDDDQWHKKSEMGCDNLQETIMA